MWRPEAEFVRECQVTPQHVLQAARRSASTPKVCLVGLRGPDNEITENGFPLLRMRGLKVLPPMSMSEALSSEDALDSATILQHAAPILDGSKGHAEAEVIH